MEYHVTLFLEPARLDAVRSVLTAADPAALIEVASDARTLMLSTTLRPHELAGVFATGGVAVNAGAFDLQPSVCCGGCSA